VALYKLFFKINDHLAQRKAIKFTQLLAHFHGLRLLELQKFL
jgi:hypothetical protein